MSGDDPKTLESPNAEVSPEERARRLKVEVERLARQPPTEWLYYLEQGDLAKKHDVPPATLKEMIETTIRANEKKAREDKAEDRQRIRRVEKDKVTAQRELAREQAKQKREQEQADKEAERKRKERKKAFEAIAKLPLLAHEARLAELRSGRAKTSTSCAMNSRPITFRRIWAPSQSSHGTSRSIRMHSCSI
jgi:hypothetical protein